MTIINKENILFFVEHKYKSLRVKICVFLFYAFL